jgi:Protein of unknown function (DUF559)
MRNLRHISETATHAVVRSADLRMDRAGIRRAMLAGALYPKYRGVYGLLPELTREGEWLAAVYAAGPGAALSGRACAKARQLSRFAVGEIEVVVPRQRRPRDGVRLIRALDLQPRDVRTRDGIPMTTVERMLVDLTDSLQPEQIANVIHEAANRRSFSVAATRAVMARAAKRRMRRLERAIEMHLAGSAGTRSGLEDRFLALVRAARIPEPVINTRIHGVEVDARWGELCVEVDGPNHLRPATRAKDEADQAALEARGLRVIRFTEAAIDLEPERVLRELGR